MAPKTSHQVDTNETELTILFAELVLSYLYGLAAPRSGLSAEIKATNAMANTYREIAIEHMLETVEDAMHQAIGGWADLPPQMKDAIEQFRTRLGAAIDSVEFVKRALDRQVHETDCGKGPS